MREITVTVSRYIDISRGVLWSLLFYLLIELEFFY